MELLHAVLVMVSWVILVVSFCWGLGWGIEEVTDVHDARSRCGRSEDALPVIRQAQAMYEIDRITTAAVAELVRIAGEELSYA